MLNQNELAALSKFARFIDCNSQVRLQATEASDLESFVAMAHQHGYHEINCDLLIKAAREFRSSTWIWQEDGQRWSDHLFMLSLAMLTEAKTANSESSKCDETGDIIYNEDQAEAFYQCARKSQQIQGELRNAQTIQAVIKIARCRGFRLRKIDFIIRMHKWDDDFFPWSSMPANKAREFAYRDELVVPPPPLAEEATAGLCKQ